MAPNRFDVDVQDGVVTLQGRCERRSFIPTVVRAVSAVDGVVRVVNRLGNLLLSLTVVAGLVPLAVSVGRAVLRRQPGLDLIALLAMAGALALGEVLAGAVIAVNRAGRPGTNRPEDPEVPDRPRLALADEDAGPDEVRRDER